MEKGSVLINPHDTVATAEALHTALSMPAKEATALHSSAYAYVTENTAQSWAAKYVGALREIADKNNAENDASLMVPPLDPAALAADVAAHVAAGGALAVFTDYDGTLTPIVDDPDAALLPPAAEAQLTRLSGGGVPTAIVSGRSRGKIGELIPVEGLWVAGSHGFEIAAAGAPDDAPSFRPAERFRPGLEAAAAALTEALAEVDGALVEDNTFAVSVHYRNVADDKIADVEEAVAAVLLEQPSLTRQAGKMVIELRPLFEWSKGKAVEHILAELDAKSGGGKKYFPLYFGDDVSDEDVFTLLRERDGPGAGVLVDARARPRTSTAASYRVRTPADVHAMLARLPLPTDAAPAAASDDDATFAP